ncbi:hypothetical protein GCM10007972_02660 [Iodidimonas muriae]|uniref:Phage holin family protein n=1 Tax=Iodidimonas muriae TaxID=261467 RepID=A0ABQ2L6X3_9PROT|nr:hypothetical protein [Iodidimonas muriae]GER06579.1 hypothetical protein JCM17843_08890 [Kordiimonadales bacterium JCM 17843]GGO05350.1 hypothetical protein GCM10007972_02660 [Iodidimonas muriae]
MIGGNLFRAAAADAAKRLLLILVAAVLIAVVAILLCGALVAALALYLPIWAALSITAVILLILALAAVHMALGQEKEKTKDHTQASAASSASAQAVDIGEMIGKSMKDRPKTTLGVALLMGVALGANPSLRRDLIDQLKNWDGGSPPVH